MWCESPFWEWKYPVVFHVQDCHSELCRLRDGGTEGYKFQASYDSSIDERGGVKQRLLAVSDSTRKRIGRGQGCPSTYEACGRAAGIGIGERVGREQRFQLRWRGEEENKGSNSEEEREEQSEGSSSEEKEAEDKSNSSGSDRKTQGNLSREGPSQQPVQQDCGQNEDNTLQRWGRRRADGGSNLLKLHRGRTQVAKNASF